MYLQLQSWYIRPVTQLNSGSNYLFELDCNDLAHYSPEIQTICVTASYEYKETKHKMFTFDEYINNIELQITFICLKFKTTIIPKLCPNHTKQL